MKKVDILLVGHYTHDIIIDSAGKRHEKQGGPPSYMTPFLKAADINFHVVSKINNKIPEFFSFHNKIMMSDRPTTSFVLDYSGAERTLKCPSICESITPEDINQEAIVSIVCGVANEILPETLEKLRQNSKYLLCDIQGFCRRIGENSIIYHIDPMKTWFADYAHLFDFIKVSSTEARNIDIEAMKQKSTVILTEGAEECSILTKDKKIHIPGFPSKETDPTGAGDAFLAGFALGLLKEKPVEECARLGNYFGSLTVKHMGVPVVAKEDLEDFI